MYLQIKKKHLILLSVLPDKKNSVKNNNLFDSGEFCHILSVDGGHRALETLHLSVLVLQLVLQVVPLLLQVSNEVLLEQLELPLCAALALFLTEAARRLELCGQQEAGGGHGGAGQGGGVVGGVEVSLC